MSNSSYGSFASNLTLTALRVVAGFIFLISGTMTVFGWPEPPAGVPEFDLMSQMGIGKVLEVVGGALLMLGLFTRITAFVMSGMMAVAYFQFHAGSDWLWPAKNGGAAAVLFCFVWLVFAAGGGGPWSLDARRSKK
jgi:putative oxidoreductase